MPKVATVSERYSRNEALFGAEGQARIAATSVAVVGLGGLGSPVAQQLAYLGTEAYALIDFDVVTESGLNRQVGAVDADLAFGTPKIAVAERIIRAVKPTARIATVEQHLGAPDALPAIAASDVVFGCLDNDRARIELTELCARLAKPYFDLATDTVGQWNEIYGGRVIFCDGSRCLVCLPDVLDQDQVALDGLGDGQRPADQRIYGVDRGALRRTGPSVVSINGVVASLAVTEFMAFVTGLREPFAQLTYRADTGVVRKSADVPAPGCYYCTGLWGSERAG
jgi:molybdopterin/thiamine biosynthesis adenylyltransferase